jgi:RimJ/RimL family protein N-acetyltransferase
MQTHAALPILQGERVTLGPLRIENLYKHFEWNNDPELNRLDTEVPYEEESLSEFKRRFERMIYDAPPAQQDFEIMAEDDTLIGVAFISNISWHDRHCKVGITIGDRNYWGQNYGREALLLVLDYCFNELDMHRVGSDAFEYNAAWRTLVEWVGFKKEGSERDYLLRDGEFFSKEIYAILENEYRERW